MGSFTTSETKVTRSSLLLGDRGCPAPLLCETMGTKTPISLGNQRGQDHSPRGEPRVSGPMSIWETRGLVHLGSEGFRAFFSTWGTRDAWVPLSLGNQGGWEPLSLGLNNGVRVPLCGGTKELRAPLHRGARRLQDPWASWEPSTSLPSSTRETLRTRVATP